MDTKKSDRLSPGQREADAADAAAEQDDLEIVETPPPKRVRPGTRDPRIRQEEDTRIQHPC